MTDAAILEQFGMVKIVSESVEPEIPAAQTGAKEAVGEAATAQVAVENARGNVAAALNAPEPAKHEPAGKPGESASKPSIGDMRKHASAAAKKLRRENPDLSIAEANDQAIAATKKHFGIEAPQSVPPQAESMAASVKKQVEENVAETGYISPYEQNLLRLTRNRTEVFEGMKPEI